MKSDKICTICHIPLQEGYCGRCGQKISGQTATTSSLITDFISNFFSVERSGFATIFKILRNPKPIVENYYAGNRNYYASPGKLLVYAIAVAALHITFFDKTILGLTVDAENVSAQYLFWLVLYPVLILVSFLAFIRSEKSLSKHLISIVYISSSLFVILIPIVDLLVYATDLKLDIWPFLVFMLSIFFWNSRVLTKRGRLHIVINTILQALLFSGIVSLLVSLTAE